MSRRFLKRCLGSGLFLSFLFLVPAVYAAIRSSENYQILSDTFASGGAFSSSDSFQLQDIIGLTPSDTATSTSPNFGTKSGFFSTFGESLTFSVGATSLELGELSSAAATIGSHTINASTDIDNGFNIAVSGLTLSNGANTITAMTTVSPSQPGVEQFGINLVANTAPAVGASPSGTSPLGAAANNYNTADNFFFSSGDIVATSTRPVNDTTFTVAYLVNIAGNTESGNYSTTLTYTATPVF